MDEINVELALPDAASAPDVVSVPEQLQDLVVDSEDVAGFLDELAKFSAAAVSEAVGLDVLCGITLSRRRRTATVAGSTHEARLIDEVQQAYGDGPCLEAMRSHGTVHVPDTSTEERWSEYCSVIADRGHLSALCVPLELDEGATAALNFFAPQPNVYDEATIRNCELYASQAERSLRLAVRIGVKQQHADDLQDAMQSRTVIDLACGIIMGQNRCTQEEAFQILKKASSTRNQKLREVAESLVTSVAKQAPVAHFEP
ncbi:MULTISPECIES: GAF and ANTAR domain-containing protein [Micrococcaceae]|jgi:GAF domain-containing protein|uniref:ANTAR domain protein n=1 Tax=Paenarthrobacter aurescens (strain TC1) TaxID=290340 RepID=A1R1K7_PAEAT|nr:MULTISPECIES: GAF and ANTAR domain-containing protein [Micrococcaceae]ABM06473.1 ANTAR domain protein [Paenarthrobacter aurescens TC1]AFR27236.1 ANTAR domain protein [Arthrobacter sp. Rue61a]MBP2267922.1 GAF domain-containing protein [Pseudarthrobacter sp. PvP004]